MELVERCESSVVVVNNQDMSVLVVENRPLLRAAMSALLAQLPFIRVLGETDREGAGLEIEQKKPDLVFVGLDEAEDLDIAKLCINGRPRLLALVARPDTELVLRAVRVGFGGVVLNSSAAIDLRRAVEAVRLGKVYIGSEAKALVSNSNIKENQPEQVPLEKLSLREQEVLKLITEGNSTKQIAAILSRSGKTIETHRLRIMRKLKLFSVAELTKYAIRNGLTGI